MEDLLPGMVLAQPAVPEDTGEEMLRKGTRLTDPLIRQLQRHNVQQLEIQESSIERARVEARVPMLEEFELTRAELGRLAADVLASLDEERSEEQMRVRRVYGGAIDTFRDLARGLHDGGGIKRSPAEHAVRELQGQMEDAPKELVKFSRIRSREDYLPNHTVNVCILSLHLGEAMGLSAGAREELALGSFLHDVGMARLPDELIEKESPLNEEEFARIQSHPGMGAQILENETDLPESLLTLVQQHHERMDGTGYPKGLEGDRISEPARILAVTDAFEAMTSPRVYHRGRTSYEAMQVIIREAGEKYWEKAARYFFQSMDMYPIGTVVELHTGEVGVVEAPTGAPMRPRIRVLLDKEGRTVSSHPTLNLLENRKTYIHRVLHEIDPTRIDSSGDSTPES